MGNEKSPGPGGTTSCLSFSFDEVNPQSEEKKLGNTFLDKQNENFEFNRSASVSQVRNRIHRDGNYLLLVCKNNFLPRLFLLREKNHQ